MLLCDYLCKVFKLSSYQEICINTAELQLSIAGNFSISIDAEEGGLQPYSGMRLSAYYDQLNNSKYVAITICLAFNLFNPLRA